MQHHTPGPWTDWSHLGLPADARWWDPLEQSHEAAWVSAMDPNYMHDPDDPNAPEPYGWSVHWPDGSDFEEGSEWDEDGKRAADASLARLLALLATA